jgi:hypothetical protein
MSNFISIANQSLTVAQMFASPPEGLGPREWFKNVDEVAHTVSYPVTGYVEEKEITFFVPSGDGMLDEEVISTKLVLRDDGPGMPPFPGGDFDLQTFVSSIAASGIYKSATLDGNQGRGFRFAWSAYNPLGIIVYSKVAGGETYRAKWWEDAHGMWRYEDPVPVLDTKPTIELGDHGTAFVMLGQDEYHNTAADPFPGWEDYKKSGLLFASQLIRRLDKPRARCRIDAQSMLVGEGNNNFSRLVHFLGSTRSNLIEDTKVHFPKADLTLEWIEHRGKRFADRGVTMIGGAEVQTFAAIVYEGEMFDWLEGVDWKEEADILTDLSYVSDMASVRIHLGPSWKNRVKQSFDRTKLEWKQGMRPPYRTCRRGKAYGAAVVAVRSFTEELTDTSGHPKWIADLIAKRKREAQDDMRDLRDRRWEEFIKQYKLMLNPAGGGRLGGSTRLIVPMPLIRSGDNDADDWFKNGAKLDVKIKPLSGTHEAKYPVTHTEDLATKGWTMLLSLNSPYVREALDVGTKAFTKGVTHEFRDLHPDQMGAVKQLVEDAAQVTLSQHFCFVMLHYSKGLYSSEDVDVMLRDQPGSTAAMQHHFLWLKMIPQIIKEFEQARAKALAAE